MKPSWRKPAGIALILLLIAAWTALVVTCVERLPHLPWPLQALFFVVAGIAWIFPMRPLLVWMETGKWRVPKA